MNRDEYWPRNEKSKQEACQLAGIVPEHHCCMDMAYAISKPKITPHQGHNRIIDWIASWNEYIIPVSHDGYASSLIRYCPWCGRFLPDSRREEWYQRLYALGFKDPGEEQIPSEYDTDQ